MTLDTRVYIIDRIDHREVFLRCNQLIGADESTENADRPDMVYTDGQHVPDPTGRRSIWNKPGQGLCALLDVSYREDGPYVREGEHARFCEPDDPEYTHEGCFPRWLEVSLDTGYGYRGDNGEGCGDLHARLVAELGQWLDSRGVAWKWENEFTGEIHSGYDRLTDLCSGGAEATTWYRTIAAPAIAAHIAGGGNPR